MTPPNARIEPFDYYAGDSNIERLLKTFRHEKTDRVPNFEYFIGQRNVSAILGRPSGNSWQLSGKDYVEMVQKIGMDAIGGNIFLDRVTSWQGANADAGGGGSILSRVPERTLLGWDDLKRYEQEEVIKPAVVNRWKLDDYFAAVEGKPIGVWVHLTLPLTLVYQAMGFENFCMALYDDLPFVEHLMEMATQDNIRLLNELLQYDFSFVHLGDDLGYKSSLLVAPEVLQEIWTPRVKRHVEAVHANHRIATYHSDGNIIEMIPTIADLGFVSINPIEALAMDIYDLKKRFGDRLAFIGNIDVAGALPFGTAEEVDREVKEHIERLAPGGGYICATSHSVIDDIPPANFLAMLKAIHKYGKM